MVTEPVKVERIADLVKLLRGYADALEAKPIAGVDNGKRIFLSDDATPEQIAEYDAAYAKAHVKNYALLAAERLLEANGYTVTFDHSKPIAGVEVRQYILTPIDPVPTSLNDLRGYGAVECINGQWVTLQPIPIAASVPPAQVTNLPKKS